MNKFLKLKKFLPLVQGIFILAIGIALIVVAAINQNNATKAISIISAICLFGVGVYAIVKSFILKNSKIVTPLLASGAVAIAVAIVFSVELYLIGNFIVLFIGAMLIAAAIIQFCNSIIFTIERRSTGPIIGSILIFAICLILGAVTLAYRSQPNTMKVIYIIMGISLVMSAMGLIFFFFFANKKIKEVKKEIEKDVVEEVKNEEKKED